MEFKDYLKEISKKTKVSKYFSWREALHSNSAIKHKISNIPDNVIRDNIIYVAGQLDIIRKRLGKEIFVSSWYRNEQVNHLAGGVGGSYHLQGLAVDIYTYDIYMDDLLFACRAVKYDKLIRYTYKKQYHIQFKPLSEANKNRQEYYLGLPKNRYKLVHTVGEIK